MEQFPCIFTDIHNAFIEVIIFNETPSLRHGLASAENLNLTGNDWISFPNKHNFICGQD